MAASGLPHDLRRKAIVIGIAAAAVLRIVFAIFATQLLNVIGLALAGGLLLMWVSWKLFRETRRAMKERAGERVQLHLDDNLRADAAHPDAATTGAASGKKTFTAALTQIVIADVSMSLDNVLAIAGTARDHIFSLVVGLALSVALMGLAATIIARVLHRLPWISYLGLALIAYVAVVMIIDGSFDLMEALRRPHGS
jgi:YjbE family integral membrane protein